MPLTTKPNAEHSQTLKTQQNAGKTQKYNQLAHICTSGCAASSLALNGVSPAAKSSVSAKKWAFVGVDPGVVYLVWVCVRVCVRVCVCACVCARVNCEHDASI